MVCILTEDVSQEGYYTLNYMISNKYDDINYLKTFTNGFNIVFVEDDSVISVFSLSADLLEELIASMKRC